MKQFWFDGKGSASMGMTISGSGTFDAAERDVESVSIPGRNGDLVVDHGRFKNVSVTYPVSICADFAIYAEAARVWLLSGAGYRRLEDDYDPEHFRMALYKGPLNFTTGFLNQTGETNIAFHCKPQRFLKSGERVITMEAPGYFNGPNNFEALPLIKVYGAGAGTLTVGTYVIEILQMEDHLFLDSEISEAYTRLPGAVRVYRNDWVKAPVFPVLGGSQRIEFSGGVEKIEITPRWWTL